MPAHKNIEVEVRGRLTSDQHASLVSTLKEKGTFIETKNRVLLDYSTFLPEEGIRERTRDIRLRVTNGQPEIITKIGNWGGKEARKELSIKTYPGTFDTLVETYAVLGYKKAVLCIRNTEVYEYKDVEFALVEVPGHSYYFEAEMMTDDQSRESELHAHLDEICKELNLSIFSKDEFYAYIELLNKEANEIFDFSNYTEKYFEKRFDLHT